MLKLFTLRPTFPFGSPSWTRGIMPQIPNSVASRTGVMFLFLFERRENYLLWTSHSYASEEQTWERQISISKIHHIKKKRRKSTGKSVANIPQGEKV